jgi:hypothetical protein
LFLLAYALAMPLARLPIRESHRFSSLVRGVRMK